MNIQVLVHGRECCLNRTPQREERDAGGVWGGWGEDKGQGRSEERGEKRREEKVLEESHLEER